MAYFQRAATAGQWRRNLFRNAPHDVGAQPGEEVINVDHLRALKSSFETLSRLVSDNRKLSGDIVEIENRGESLTNVFVGQVSYAMGFFGSGLVFGNPLIPCYVSIRYVVIICVLLVATAINSYVQMHYKVKTLAPKIGSVKFRKALINESALELLGSENQRITEERARLGMGGNILEPADDQHSTLTSLTLVEKLNSIIQCDMHVGLEDFAFSTYVLTVVYFACYGGVLFYVAYYTFCTVSARCNPVLAQDI